MADSERHPPDPRGPASVPNVEKNDHVRGWLKQEVAFYEHFRSPTESQHILRSTICRNPQVLHPVEGIEYERLSPLTVGQATGCGQYLRSTYNDPNELVLDTKALLDDLVFKPGTSNSFEQPMADRAGPGHAVVHWRTELPCHRV